MPAGQPMMAVPMMVQPDRSTAGLAHILGAILGWIGPLIIYAVKKDQDPFVRHHSTEALNAALTMLIAYFVHMALMFVLIGFVTLFVHWIVYLVWAIQGMQAANRGEMYQYPMIIRMVT